MSNKYRVLSVVLAVLLTVSAIMPETFFASANDGYINEDCSVKNTFDEENVVYSSEEIEADGKISYVTVNDEIGIGEYKLSRHGKFEENSGVADSNAVRFYQVRGSSETDKDVSYIRILNSEDSSYNWFVPDANSKYTVKISYKSEKNYNFVLREVGSFGEVNYDDNVLGTFEDETVENGWKVASAQFTTSKDTTEGVPLLRHAFAYFLQNEVSSQAEYFRMTAAMASNCSSMSLTSLNWVRQRSRFCSG